MRKNDNRLVKFTAFVLLLTIIAVSLVSGTFAKYTSKANGSDTATVAKWSFNVTDSAGTTTDVAGTEVKTLTFDIFSTLANETNVAKTDGTLIAPGTTGSFKFDVENASQVTAKYKVDYTIVNEKNVPLEFTTTPDDEDSWSSDIASINQAFENIAIGATDETTVIHWRWAFTDASDMETRDNADTALGVMGTLPTVTVTATISVEQVD